MFNKHCLSFFKFLLLIALYVIGQIILSLIYIVPFVTISQDKIEKNWIRKFDEQDENIKRFVQTVQEFNRCCAIDGWKDYVSLRKVPDSCCGVDTFRNSSATGSCKKISSIFTSGCETKFLDLFKEKFDYNLLIGSFSAIFFGIVSTILNYLYLKQIKEQNEAILL